jgi:hypothetical protein
MRHLVIPLLGWLGAFLFPDLATSKTILK